MPHKSDSTSPLVEKRYFLPFILVTALFALWGFANDITNPMVAAFQTVMEISATKASFIQFAFYGGYATMALPAAFFIRRYSYKSGILIGLALYAIGAFLFIPAASFERFSFFCLSLYILTFGLAFLETTANPFILSLGSKDTATRRLNLSQAFNPIGSLSGMAVASLIILPSLISDARDDSGDIIFNSLSASEKASIRIHDLAVIRDPYVALGLVVLLIFFVFLFTRMPVKGEAAPGARAIDSMRRLWHNRRYCFGVMTQIFYVAAQIMVWTFIIHYADCLGINKATAQNFNIAAMALSLCFRFIGTALMKHITPSTLLSIFGIGAICSTTATILLTDCSGLYFLVSISAFMSIMFPTIYGIALQDVKQCDFSIGAAFLVMAIVGGALMPPMQAAIIDLGSIAGFPATNLSFILPLICFIIVTTYGLTSRPRP